LRAFVPDSLAPETTGRNRFAKLRCNYGND
jgi:hypothetical protein